MSKDGFLGKGGYGSVYRLPGGAHVVKLFSGMDDYPQKEFTTSRQVESLTDGVPKCLLVALVSKEGIQTFLGNTTTENSKRPKRRASLQARERISNIFGTNNLPADIVEASPELSPWEIRDIFPICGFHSKKPTEHVFAMVSEYAGESLKLVMRKTHVRGIDLFRAILKTLVNVHENGIWHLDVKMDNITVSESGEFSLIDWGISIGEGNDIDIRTFSFDYYIRPHICYALESLREKEGKNPNYDVWIKNVHDFCYPAVADTIKKQGTFTSEYWVRSLQARGKIAQLTRDTRFRDHLDVYALAMCTARLIAYNRLKWDVLCEEDKRLFPLLVRLMSPCDIGSLMRSRQILQEIESW